MAFEIEKKSAEHSLFLFDRKEIKITGVSKIISFDDSYVMLSSVLGDIDVSGNNMNVDALDLESGYALISGEICGINYIDDSNKKKKRFCGLIYGLLDVCASLLLFLPLFAEKNGDSIKSISLIMLNGVQSYLKISLLTIIISTVIFGILTLALQNLQVRYWSKCRTAISLSLGSLALLLFIICSQPYAAILAFALLMIKALLIIKQK